ncbi:MAG TPA: hypothetical protein PKA00_05855 [Saprospiraceae bacterium]|nr:hypothetical protein [Saprospiraceae bacterium]HMQ82407.1 hypothetical protein [Saprospiraceae bacterium]
MFQWCALFFLFPFAIMGQNSLLVGETDINQLEAVRIIDVDVRWHAGFFYAKVDYGQENCRIPYNRCKINTPDGAVMEFASTVAVINYLEARGWRLDFVYQRGDCEDQEERFLFRKN